MQEDHVSMGWSAARKLRRSIDGLGRVLAIELMTAARGIEMRGEGAAPVVARVIEVLRTRVPAPGPDRYLAPDIAGAVELVQTGALLTAAGLGASIGSEQS
jgi:histidine ammonia-lyase